MSLKINDYMCDNTDCQIRGSVWEVLAKEDETIQCPHCKASLKRLIGNPAGRVVGTDNPCSKR